VELLKIGDVIRLAIKDNGNGFDPDRLVLGMGLSSIRNRCELMNAQLKILSKPGKGTRIIIKKKQEHE
jgi:signal transduction histidine kinase